ncbi:MAG: aspartate kinase [Clostridia bacterium]|nr:aspartate kinase [Clostridia bacterium]
MSIKVCKFGGTSMADGNNIRNVIDIIKSDRDRRYVVVSAPGKRYSNDIKVTDLLYQCQKEVEQTGACKEAFSKIRERFENIVKELGVDMDIATILNQTEQRICTENSADFAASRGEYLSGQVMAGALGVPFVDAQDVVLFNDDGSFAAEESYMLVAKALADKPRAVVGGFYGSYRNGKVKTFSRGGSDISGAIVARAVLADVYENWTDVSGFLACDPRIVDHPQGIKVLSYKELRELSYMGANVLHSESIFPVKSANIPINIKNTFRPEDEGTMIVPITKYQYTGNVVTGIAGKKNFTVIHIEKSMMNAEIGFTRKILSVLEKNGISFEHMPSGIDTMCLVVESAILGLGVLDRLLTEIEQAVNPDHVRVYNNIALVATVGHGMSSSIGTSGRLFKALSDANVNVRMIDQGSSELNIIVGVADEDCNKAIKAIYREFFPAN